MILSLLLKADFNCLKLFFLPIIPFSIFFENGAKQYNNASNILINRELILQILNKSNQK
jgi:hypothetical protein